MIKLSILFQTVAIVFTGVAGVQGSYNYAYWGEIESAESMHALRIVDNSNIVDESGNRNPIELGDLRDVFVYEDHLYVSDATAHKVYILNSDFEYVKSLPEADDESGKLNTPTGLYVFKDELYVADYNNNRVAIFDLVTDL